MNDDAMYSFSGYALKYAQCQPIQYFSEDAIVAGEHSPMIVQDVVVLRLCPKQSCSKDSQYGCHYNYAEYAMALADYLRIMLKFSAIKQENICGYCQKCLNNNNNNRRRLEDGGEEEQQQEENNDNNEGDENQDNNNNNENNEDNAADNNDNNDGGENDDFYQYNDDGNAAYNYDDDGNQNYFYYGEGCEYADTYCQNYNDECVGGDDDNNNGAMAYEDYQQYLDCSQVDYNDYAYFVRPKCDGSDGSIEMAVYYDNYCLQAADVNVRNLGLGFKQGIFEEMYSGECMDCSESVSSSLYFDVMVSFCF